MKHVGVFYEKYGFRCVRIAGKVKHYGKHEDWEFEAGGGLAVE